MKLHDLVEGRDAPLYHFADTIRMYPIIETDILAASWTHYIPAMNGKQETHGTSLTRNPNLPLYGKDYRIEFRQDVLAQTNRIIPLNSEYAYQYGTGSPDKMPDHLHHRYPRAVPWMEEFVVGPVKAVHRAIVEIRHQSPLQRLSPLQQYTLLGKMDELGLFDWSKRWGIPLKYKQGELITDTRKELEELPEVRDWLELDYETS